MTEGRFYEALEGRLPKTVSIVFENAPLSCWDVIYVASNKDHAEAWAKDRVRWNTQMGFERQVWVEEWSLDGDDTCD